MSLHWKSLPTSDKIEAIKTVWIPEASASEIASCFNGATRNAIIGVYHRYTSELAGHPLRTPSRLMRAVRQRRDPSHSEGAVRQRRDPAIKLKPHATYTMREAPVSVGEAHLCGKPLVMLEHKECKFPVNEAEQGGLHLFCGLPTEGSYCAHHKMRSYHPVSAPNQEQ